MKNPASWLRFLVIGLGLGVALAAAPVSADVWDNDPGNEDDSVATDNELFHGAIQTHDHSPRAGCRTRTGT